MFDNLLIKYGLSFQLIANLFFLSSTRPYLLYLLFYFQIMYPRQSVVRTNHLVGSGVRSSVLSPPLIRSTSPSSHLTGHFQQHGQIKGQSRLEYVPYEKKIIEYEAVERSQMVPYEKKVIEYQQRKRYEQVPVQRTYTDYYAIEHITQYLPQVIPQTKIQYVPVERIENRIQYYPVEKQVVHYPEENRRSTFGNTAQNYVYQQPIVTNIQNQPTYTTPYGIGPTSPINYTFAPQSTNIATTNTISSGRLLGGPISYPTGGRQGSFVTTTSPLYGSRYRVNNY